MTLMNKTKDSERKSGKHSFKNSDGNRLSQNIALKKVVPTIWGGPGPQWHDATVRSLRTAYVDVESTLKLLNLPTSNNRSRSSRVRGYGKLSFY